MSTFRIRGGRPLSGSIRMKSAKNSAVALMCASLLTTETTILDDVPRIEEVYRIAEVLASIGVSISWSGDRQLTIVPPRVLKLKKMDRKAAMRTRSVLLLIGALVARTPSFEIPRSGGCHLGKRTVKPHLYALEELGIRIETDRQDYRVRRKELRGSHITMYESGDTTTENVLLAAVLAKGVTTVHFASANYMVQDLCWFLTAMGAKIDGIGSTRLKITGVHRLKGTRYSLIPDPVESMVFLSLAATTRSRLLIQGCPWEFLELELLKMKKMGFRYQIVKRYLSKSKHFELIDIQTEPSRFVALEEKIYARPYPGLNIDHLPLFVPLATQARGTTLIHDWVYENRALYYTEMQKLGADVLLADPHRVFIKGPTKLEANEIICPPALRPSVTILIGMLAAKGTSILRNVYSIDRGYEDLCGRLQSLGARIERIEDQPMEERVHQISRKTKTTIPT